MAREANALFNVVLPIKMYDALRKSAFTRKESMASLTREGICLVLESEKRVTQAKGRKGNRIEYY